MRKKRTFLRGQSLSPRKEKWHRLSEEESNCGFKGPYRVHLKECMSTERCRGNKEIA